MRLQEEIHVREEVSRRLTGVSHLSDQKGLCNSHDSEVIANTGWLAMRGCQRRVPAQVSSVQDGLSWQRGLPGPRVNPEQKQACACEGNACQKRGSQASDRSKVIYRISKDCVTFVTHD